MQILCCNGVEIPLKAWIRKQLSNELNGNDVYVICLWMTTKPKLQIIYHQWGWYFVVPTALWCWVKFKCLTKSQSVLTSKPFSHKITWSHWLPFMVLFFIWALYRSRVSKTSQQWRWQHEHPLRVHAIQNTRATIVRMLWINYKLMLMLEFTSKDIIYKRKGIWPVILMALHNSGIGVWTHNHSPVMYPSTNPPWCVIPCRSQTHTFSLYNT